MPTFLDKISADVDRDNRDITNGLAYREKLKRSLMENVNLFPQIDDLLEKVIPYLSIYYTFSELGITFPWHVARVEEVIRRFTELGWTIQEDKDNVKEYKQRSFKLVHPNFDDVRLTVTVNMNASRPDSKCNLVVDHIEMVEKPIYRVECDPEDF